MSELNRAVNYSLFTEKHAADGAFHNNVATFESLQDTVVLKPQPYMNVLVKKPSSSPFKGDKNFQLKPDPLPDDSDYLTHPKYDDGTVMPLVPMSMGNITSHASETQVDAVSIGTTESIYHCFQDTMFKDNKFLQ